MSAAGALVEMATECGSTTPLDGPQDLRHASNGASGDFAR